MFPTLRAVLASLTVCLVLGVHATAQSPLPVSRQTAAPAPQQQFVTPPQQGAQQPIGVPPQGFAPQQQSGVPQQPPAVPQAPPGFQLNPLEQTYLDNLLATWEVQSSQISTFKCSFERWEFNPTFGPGPDIPLNKDKGELSFKKPDKGSFQITEIWRWTPDPVPPGQAAPQIAKGNWKKQEDAIGEHWVCDGKSVFEYRHDQKQLVERPIPAELQGQAIVDGPLPFFFGADPKKLKDRYWMRVEQQPNASQVWLVALPKFQAQAADLRGVRVIFDRQKTMPTHMEVHLPDGSRHVYMFDVANATVNSPWAKLQQFFERPRTPGGWKRVVEQAPVQQAAQPTQPPR